MAATVILLASAVAFARVIAQLAAVAPRTVGQLYPPLLAMFAVMAALAGLSFILWRTETLDPGPDDPPTDLRAAVGFGLMYAVVLLVVAAVRDAFGTSGLYTVAVIGGLPDINAVTLSTAELAAAGRVEASVAWRAILLAALANLVFKGGVAVALGPSRLALRLVPFFGAALAAGAAVFFLW